jgi:hypothetical protein
MTENIKTWEYFLSYIFSYFLNLGGMPVGWCDGFGVPLREDVTATPPPKKTRNFGQNFPTLIPPVLIRPPLIHF